MNLQTKILEHCTDSQRDIKDLSILCNAEPMLVKYEIQELLREGKIKEFPDPLARFYSRYKDNTVYLTTKD